MVDKKKESRPRGRPRSFDPDTALDAAVRVFWRRGYEGADTASLARAMGLTKPSVYAAFGDKQSLFLHALRRYGATVGSEAVAAFYAEKDIRQAVAAFFASVAETQSGARGARGCLIACVASQCAETMPEVRTFLAAGLEATDRALADRFCAAIEDGTLRQDFPAEDRARLMTDLMQASAIRARAQAKLSPLAKANAAVVLAL